MVEGNFKKLYLFKTLRWFLLIIPVIVPFYQSVGLSMAQILTLQSVFSIAIVVLEVPSGYFADIIGRRKSLIVGSFLSTAGFLMYSLSYTFTGFLAAELVMGMGASFISGADSALVYDSLLSLGRKDDYKKVWGRSSALGNFSEATASIIGGLLAAVSLRLPFYIETAVIALTIPLAFSLVEPALHEANKRRGSFRDIIDTVKYALHGHKELKWLLLYGAILGASTLTMVWFVQPYFKLCGLPLAWYGAVWAAYNLSVGLFSLSAHGVERAIGRRGTLLMLLPLSAGAYILVSFFNALWILPFFLIFYFVRGINGPVIGDYMNSLISSERRATIMSVNALMVRLIFSIVGPLAGLLSDHYTVSLSLRWLGLLFLVVGLYPLLKLTQLRQADR
ncbi:MAG: MFS transporter [Fibrobacteres bacterium]|nr:MFS transporter [Fibrobacterota bacterium]